MTYSKILVAIDQSPLGQAVFAQALDLAKTQNASLMLFHCLMPEVLLSPMLMPGEFGLSPHLISQTYKVQQEQLDLQVRTVREMLEHYTKVAAQQGVPAEFSYRCVDAGRGICELASSWNADLVILGRRGIKGLTEVLLGSVSNYVLHHASCSVLVVQTATQQLGDQAKIAAAAAVT